MLSRVAQMVYWMARYLERAENTARIIDVNSQLVLDLQSGTNEDPPNSWEPLVYVCGGHEKFEELYGDEADERTVVEFMLFDRRNPGSIMSCVAAARENARCIRDQLATEVWETLNTFYLQLKKEDYTRYAQLGATAYINGIKESIQRFYGVAASMMPRSQAWWFFELGRFLERADNTSRIIDVKYYMLLPGLSTVGSAVDMVQWASVLRSCSGFEAFRRTHRGRLSLEPVLEYLLRDPIFPRSIAFSFEYAEIALQRIAASADHLDKNPALDALAEARAHIIADPVKAIIASGLHEYLDDIQLRVQSTHETIVATFFEYPTTHARILA